LVERLLAPSGKLKVHTGITTDLELMDYSPVGHHYPMPDHGLFISGIVNSIAPDATLHLIKVSTPYGVASIETIAQGILEMLRIRKDAGNPRFIVNCSCGSSPDEGPDFPIQLRDPVTHQPMNTSLRAIFDGLTKEKDVVVVAAAGNSAHEDVRTGARMRPEPRFPAIHGDVIAVGALPRTSSKPFIAASYSNRAGSGYMTLGGEAGPGNGVLGLYTSEFPVYAEGCLSFLWRMLTGKGLDGWAGPGHLPPNPQAFTIDHLRYKANRTGWAWWAGTSFAAPILAGLLATRWSNPGITAPLNCASAHTELDKNIQSVTTSDTEKVILITQGNP
jgi:subtilisin family serine protease